MASKNQRPPRSPRIDDAPERITGTVSVNPRGFGFVNPSDKADADVFIPPPLLRSKSLIDGDLVDVVFDTSFDGLSRTARHITLLSRSRTRLFGRVQNGSLLPDPFTALVAVPLRRPYPPTGETAVVDITETPARIISVHGPASAPAALLAQALERGRVAEVDAANIVDKVLPAEDHTHRRDLSDLVTFTIDGPESRDLDDALSVMRLPDGVIRLFVHIADVASAVPLGSPIDERARAMGTSVYLPGHSIPMIPPALSYEHCSLLPNQPRATLTVSMDISPEGEITNTELFESHIVSNARLSYTEVAGFLEEGTSSLDHQIQAALSIVHQATTRLGVLRRARGGLSAQEIEAMDDITAKDGRIVRVHPDEADIAHDLIEEAMVAANESVASYLLELGLHGVFRVHAAPDDEAVPALTAFASSQGINIPLASPVTPASISEFEAALAADGGSITELFSILSDYMSRAEYTPSPGSHFGLASSGYVHFTSPIRRYADLTVHRIIKAHLAGQPTPNIDLVELCESINASTARAARAESVARNLFWLAHLSASTPQKMRARIVRVSERGIYVRLIEYGLGSLLRARDLDPRGDLELLGPTSIRAAKRVFSIGQEILVKKESLDLAAGTIDFKLVS